MVTDFVMYDHTGPREIVLIEKSCDKGSKRVACGAGSERSHVTELKLMMKRIHGPSWTSTNPTSSMFSLYSTSPVGVFGSMIKKTDVEGILRLDCNVTDFYSERPYPVYLYYNPYDVEKTVTYQTSEKADIFDIISKTFLSKGVAGEGQIPIPPKGAVVVYELPSGTILKYEEGKIIADGKYTILN